MKNTKTLFAAALIAACTMSQPVLADVTESATLPALESTDLNFAFEQTAQPMQVAMLSEQEMKETEGAVFWWGVAGFVGGVVNTYSYYSSNPTNWSVGGAAFAFGSGAGGALVASLPGSAAWIIGRGAIGGIMAGQPNPW